jgi:hypothetical protein
VPENLPWTEGPAEETPRPVEARRKREKPTNRNPKYGASPIGDKKCGGNKKDGSKCTQAAGFGTDHPGYGKCKFHLGQTPAVRTAAAREMAQELMAFYGQPIDTNPIDALLEEVSRTAGHVAWLGKRISQFNVPLELEELDPETKASKVVTAAMPPEIEGWLRIYLSERAHLVRTAKAALDAGVNERLVQIAEHQGAKLADAIETILAALNLTAAQQRLVPAVVPSVLRQLSSLPAVVEGQVG